MALDILNITATGNLTEDANVTNFPKKEKAVINFTIATNLSKTETIFLNCNYWVSTKKTENSPEKSIIETFLEMLKKGKKVTIYSDYATLKKSENEEKNTFYTNFNISVKQFVLV